MTKRFKRVDFSLSSLKISRFLCLVLNKNDWAVAAKQWIPVWQGHSVCTCQKKHLATAANGTLNQPTTQYQHRVDTWNITKKIWKHLLVDFSPDIRINVLCKQSLAHLVEFSTSCSLDSSGVGRWSAAGVQSRLLTESSETSLWFWLHPSKRTSAELDSYRR